ncbi:MAG: DGQHR domain-containing protein [Fulvivirga sp.]|uniref:DGQHR domain-containing protein n=1 Tax=Fulvivirga sp. TaxID=1931237 RepID=UPI0032EC6707
MKKTHPYIRVKQRGEVFFLTKFTVAELKDKVDLHFRDPYMSMESLEYQEKYTDYIEKIRKKGLELSTDNEEGVQRRLQLNRINDIRNYIQNNVNNFFPNSILISANTASASDFNDDDYLNLEKNDFGEFLFPDSVRFSVIDGQHRLAGLFLAEEQYLEEFEVPVVLLLNVSLPTAAKLFSDINGKQKAVNKSLIYDLYEHVSDSDVELIRKYHTICQKFYTDPKSPLFRQIKMLGMGSGAVSQSFFIDLCSKYVEKTSYASDIQNTYEQLFYYFRSFQETFPSDWPIPKNSNELSLEELDLISREVLVDHKSQLVKTNGFGAIMRAFPKISIKADGKFENYMMFIKQLEGKISWKRAELDQKGGGTEIQRFLYERIVEVLNLR